MKKVTVTNNKGGLGKTTIAHVLACGLAHKGKKVLVCDLDPSMNLTTVSGINPIDIKVDLHDLFEDPGNTRSAIMQSEHGFSILPGSMQFAKADKEFTETGREYHLKEILKQIDDQYDYCIIDTPPSIGILTINALTASDEAIIPMAADSLSIQGLSQLNGLIENVRKYCNPDLKIAGMLVNRFNQRTVISRDLREALEDVAEQMGTKVYKTNIRDAIIVKEVQFLREDLFRSYPKAKITDDFNDFVDEFLKGEKGKKK